MSARGEIRDSSLASLCFLLALLAAPTGCSPSLNIAGVYFPGWLVSIVAGIVVAYGMVHVLSRRPQTRQLADSGLFFLSLAAGGALSVWWVCFSGF
jgi:hypothetical protein